MQEIVLGLDRTVNVYNLKYVHLEMRPERLISKSKFIILQTLEVLIFVRSNNCSTF